MEENEKHWERIAREMQKDKDDSEALGGCLAIVLIIVGFVFIALIETYK